MPAFALARAAYKTDVQFIEVQILKLLSCTNLLARTVEIVI
jgi:hypothetical protein